MISRLWRSKFYTLSIILSAFFATAANCQPYEQTYKQKIETLFDAVSAGNMKSVNLIFSSSSFRKEISNQPILLDLAGHALDQGYPKIAHYLLAIRSQSPQQPTSSLINNVMKKEKKQNIDPSIAINQKPITQTKPPIGVSQPSKPVLIQPGAINSHKVLSPNSDLSIKKNNHQKTGVAGNNKAISFDPKNPFNPSKVPAIGLPAIDTVQ